MLLYILGRLVTRLARGWIFAGGITLGLLGLTRENALILAPLIALWIFRRSRGGPPRGRILDTATFAGGVMLALLPVGVRNGLVGGEFLLTTPNFGANLFIGNNERADGRYAPLREWRGPALGSRQDSADLFAEYRDSMELAERELGRRLRPGEASGYWADRSLAFVREHPVPWLLLTARKLLLVWNAGELADSEEPEAYCDHSLVLRIFWPVSHFGSLAPLAIAGIVFCRRDRGRHGPLYLVLFGFTTSVAAFYVLARYRYPMVPVLALFAAAMLRSAFERLKSRDFRSLELPLYSLAVAASLVNWRHFPEDKPRAITSYNLGVALALRGRSGEAIASFAKALEIRPDLVQARFDMANELRAAGRIDEAVAEYRRVLEVMPDNTFARDGLAIALSESGREEEAGEHRRRAEEIRSGPAVGRE